MYYYPFYICGMFISMMAILECFKNKVKKQYKIERIEEKSRGDLK